MVAAVCTPPCADCHNHAQARLPSAVGAALGLQANAPAVVTAIVIVIAWTALKPRAISGPAGEQALPVQQAVK